MPSLMNILRDIFVRSVSTLAEQKLQVYIEKNCIGCRYKTPPSKQPRDHNICIMMSWSEQVISFLPVILKELTVEEIETEYKKMFNRMRPTWTMHRVRKVPMPFYIRTFLYIYLEEMCTTVELQTSIAQAIYGEFRSGTSANIDEFGKQYIAAIKLLKK